MLVRVLGPLAVGGVGPPIGVRPPRSARLLARLVVEAPRFVSVDGLVEVLWREGHLPARPERAVHDAAADLRRFLRQFADSKAVETRPDGRGYRLAIADDELDASVATMAMRAATDAFDRRAWGDAVARFGAILELFRGDPYEEFPYDDFAVFETERLRSLRLDAQEGRLLSLASQGDHSFLSDAAHLAPQHPSRWRIWAAWMHALHVEGRQGEALDVYRLARRCLAEVGLEPRRELRELDRRIAIDDPTLTVDAVPHRPAAAVVGRVPTILEAGGRPFVARADELDVLAGWWRQVTTGVTTAVALTGEEGIGKSSVVSTFARRVARSGGTVLAGRCQPELTCAYQPVSEALGSHLGPLDSAATNAVAHDGPDGALASLLGETAEVPDALPSPDALSAARNRLFQGVARVLDDLAAPHPVLLVLEDLHWVDRNTADLIGSLVRTMSASKLMILLTARQDEVGDDHPLHVVFQELVRHPSHADIRLDGFDDAAIEDFLEVVWPELTERVELVEPLRASTEGNPLFLGEIVHELRHESEVAESVALLTSSLVPQGIREVTNRRMSKLAPDARRVLSVAAILGTQFSVPTLEMVGDLGGRTAVLRALEQSVEAGILMDSTVSGEMAFRHQYFRDVAYQKLVGPRRADLHLQVAGTLERSSARVSPRVIAHHLLEAGAMGDVDRAIDAALTAARQAVSQLDAADAAALLRRALGILDRGGQTDLVRRCEVVVLLAQLLLRSGDFVEAKAVAADAWHLAHRLGDEAKMVVAAVESGRFGTPSGADPVSIDLLERTLALATSPEHRAQIMARLAYHIGAFGDDNQRAARLAREALVIAEQTGDRVTLTRAIWSLGIATLGQPNALERAAFARRLIEAADVSGDEVTLGNGLRLLAMASFELGQIDDFDLCVDRLDALASEVSSWLHALDVARWRALRAEIAGDWERADHYLEQHGRLGGAQGAFTISHVGQQVIFALERGDAGVVRQLTELTHARAPRFDILRGVLALLEAREGHREAAVSHFAALTEAGPSTFLSRTYPMNVALLIETAARLDLSPTWLDSEMERYRGTLVTCSFGEGCVGAADRYVGIARAIRGVHDAADESFSAAAELERRAGSVPLLARTSYWRSWAAIRRDGGVSDIAEAHLRDCRDQAERARLWHLAGECDELERHARIPAANRT